MDSNLFNSHDSAPSRHQDSTDNLQSDLSNQFTPNLQPNPNSLIQNGINTNSHQEGSADLSAPFGLPEPQTAFFANDRSPLSQSVPSESDHAFHILAKLGFSTSPQSHVHTHVALQKPCSKITIKVHENYSRPQEQLQDGRNSDPFNLLNCKDMFSNMDSHMSVSHEKIMSTTVTPPVPKPLRKPLTEEKLETVSSQSNVQIFESPQKSNTTTPDYSTPLRETPMSTNHTVMGATPNHTPNHIDDYIDPLANDNLRRSSMSTDKTLDSRRESSANELMRDQPEKPLVFINENFVDIKSERMGQKDTLSNERYRLSSLQITSENKVGNRCSCNIF